MSEREPTNAELLAAINGVRTELGGEIAALESGLHGEMASLQSSLRREITQLGTDLRGEIVQLGTDLRGEIGQLDASLRGEIAASRAETSKLFEGVQTSLDGIREDLTVLGGANDRLRQAGQNTRDEGRAIADSLANIERILLKHGTRLDELEKRTPKS